MSLRVREGRKERWEQGKEDKCAREQVWRTSRYGKNGFEQAWRQEGYIPNEILKRRRKKRTCLLTLGWFPSFSQTAVKPYKECCLEGVQMTKDRTKFLENEVKKQMEKERKASLTKKWKDKTRTCGRRGPVWLLGDTRMALPFTKLTIDWDSRLLIVI